MNEWTVMIPRPTPSLNETSKMNKFALQRLKKEWFYLLVSALNLVGVPKVNGQFRNVSITRGSAGELDHDNLVGGAKEVLLDNLRVPKIWRLKSGKVRSRIGTSMIVDDNPRWVRVDYSQLQLPRGAEGFTVLTVRDLEE